jgi:hypothetical protein
MLNDTLSPSLDISRPSFLSDFDIQDKSFFTSTTDRGTVCTYRNNSTNKASIVRYFAALAFFRFRCSLKRMSTRYHILNWRINATFFSDIFARKISAVQTVIIISRLSWILSGLVLCHLLTSSHTDRVLSNKTLYRTKIWHTRYLKWLQNVYKFCTQNTPNYINYSWTAIPRSMKPMRYHAAD